MLNYSIKIIQRIILFAFILLLTFNMAGCKRNTITIQYMLEVPNLQFVETRYYFDGQWRIGSRLREKDDELLDVGKVYTDSIINNKIDVSYINDRFRNRELISDIGLFNNFKYDDALELADMIFDNELDRYYFLKQLYKLYNLDEEDLNREMSKVLKLTRL